MKTTKPTPADLVVAQGKYLRDIFAPRLQVVFCGINPSLYSAAVGHHFARPGNRFWPTLYAASFTDRLLSPSEDRLLLTRGYGITNIVRRATAKAEELSPEELAAGRRGLLRKVRRLQPRCLAVLGVTAYRIAWKQPQAALGLQDEPLGTTKVWVLPNPSGLNANYLLPELTRLYRELREAIVR
jgi:TDG/mug DNA glycosylase family protein